MRASFVTPGSILALALSFTSWPAQAQFGDEFGDEFGDQPAEPAQPARPPAGGDEFGDEFGEETGGQVEAQTDFEDAADEFGEDVEPVEAPPPDEEALRAQRFRASNTLLGPVGGLHVVDAGSGAVDSFRVQLATEFFFVSDFLETGDENDHIGGYLSLSWTVHEMVELYMSISSYANSNPLEDPSLFQVLGDTLLGVKVFTDVTPFLTLGGDIGLGLLNTVGDIGLVLGSTSLGIRGNATADLRGLASPVPFIARLNLQYWFDNSRILIEDVEQARYSNLEDPMPIEDEDRHLITRIERFALGINRTDFFNIGIGLEAPLRAAEDLYIHPLLEWTWGIPVNRQGYDCLFLESEPGSEEPAEGEDGCLDKQGLGAAPMSLTLGVKVLPPVRGLQILAGVDIGLTGTSTFVREVAPTAPYNIMLGLGYAYDTRPPPSPEPVIQEVERRVEVRVPPPPKGRVMGTVIEQGANTPVAGAQIAFPAAADFNPIVATEQGTFASYQFDPGEVQMAITHPEYNPGGCVATIPEEGGDAEVRCELVALPRVGSVRGTVTGAEGAAISGQVVIEGPENRNVTSDAAGRFSVEGLQPGSYNARVEAEGHLIKLVPFEVQPRETTNVQITLVPRPRQPLVRVQRDQIRIRRQINFATDSAEILENSYPLMEEIADVIIRNPELSRIEIQGHTDNRGSAEHNMELSQRRAESVRQWLVQHGVDENRLAARGYGMTEPLVPNITPANRARNRRVQFVIQERAAQ